MGLFKIETLDNQGNIIDIKPLEVWEQVWIHSGVSCWSGIMVDDWNCNSPKNNKRKREDVYARSALRTSDCDVEQVEKIPRFNSK